MAVRATCIGDPPAELLLLLQHWGPRSRAASVHVRSPAIFFLSNSKFLSPARFPTAAERMSLVANLSLGTHNTLEAEETFQVEETASTFGNPSLRPGFVAMLHRMTICASLQPVIPLYTDPDAGRPHGGGGTHSGPRVAADRPQS